MLPKLLVSARLHRQWYTAGDTVRAELFLHCPPTAPDDEDGVPALCFDRALNYFSDLSADVPLSLVVTSLTAHVVGVCAVDPRRLRYALPTEPGSPLAASDHCDAFAAPYDAHILFRSDTFPVAADVALREGETRALVVTFVLPEGLPPSFRGQCARLYYGLHVQGAWRRVRGPAAETALRLRVPLRVVSPQAAVAPLLLPLLFPLHTSASASASASASVSDGPVAFASGSGSAFGHSFAFDSVALPAVPTPAVTDPLCDAARPSESSAAAFSALSVSAAARALGRRLAEQRTPVDIAVRIAGVRAVSLALESTTVAAGAALRGEFVVHESRAARVVKVCGVVELLECCRAEYVRDGIVCHPLPGGEEGLVVAQTTVVDEMEWALVNRTCVPFEVPFTNPNLCASMQTDVVTTCWQLRLRFLWCTPHALEQRLDRQRTEIPIEEEEPELVIPLTVVPPPHPEQPCIGALVQVLCKG